MQKSKKNWVIIELAIRYGRKKSRKDILSFCFFCTEIQHRLNISRGDDMDIVQITDRILVYINASDREYKNRCNMWRSVIKKRTNYNGQYSGQYITDSFNDKE